MSVCIYVFYNKIVSKKFSNYFYIPLKYKMATEEKVFTTRNLSKYNAYDIRQELVRRGAFDFKDDDDVNYRTLVQRLMVELVKEETQLANERTEKIEQSKHNELEQAKKLRELKKQEAIERSRQRQSNPEYFKNKEELNKKPAVSTIEPNTTSESADSKVDVNDEAENNEETDNDPFRSYKAKTRPKLYVK